MSQRAPDKDVDRKEVDRKEVDRLIAATHKRFVKAMDGRLDHMSPELKETYYSLLSKLVSKLETNDKGLREIAQEMMTEAMGDVLQVMQS